MNQSFTIPLAILAGGLIVAGAVYFSVAKPDTGTGRGDPALVRPISSQDHILGNPAAPVMIVEYADFDCEFCKGFDSVMKQVVASEGVKGEVALVFRHFPLSEIHPNALSHARAAECAAAAGGNDGFWKFMSELFKNQPVSPGKYGEIARNAGIPADAFAACYAKVPSEIETRIAADRQNALDVGAVGTPYSLILVPGRAPVVMNGAYSYDAALLLVQEAIDKVR